MKQYLIFLKYTRAYLSEVTGYSKNYLSRIATGARAPSEVFIGVCCHTLKESQDDLFRLAEVHAVRTAPTDPEQLNKTMGELVSRLTGAEAEIEKIKAELKQYS